MTRIVAEVADHHPSVWGTRTVALQHSLADSPLFTDASLAALLDAVDPAVLGIKTMGYHCPDPASWYRCTAAGVRGADVLEAVRHGKVWVNLSGVHEADARFARVLDGLYDELEAGLPGFRTSKRRLGLLISSPGAHVVYHCDPLGQGLVQVRGRKRVWIYPPVAPFLEPREIEDIVRGVSEEELTYQPWFDEYAEVHDLEPGTMLYWPLNSPHRVENHDSLNVSLTTEHWTRDIRSSYAMNYGNGLLRARGASPRSRSVHGAAYWVKVGLTAVERVRRGRSAATWAAPSFVVDPSMPSGVRALS